MPPSATPVRALHADDRSRWNDLWEGYLKFYQHQLAPEITEQTWQRLTDPTFPLHGLVAMDGAQVIGFVHYHFHISTWSASGYCYLEDLFVDPSVRGKGAGRALIEAVYADADARGADRVYWATQSFNTTARRLYDQLARLTPFVQYARDR